MGARNPDRVFKVQLTSKTSSDGTEVDITTSALDGNLTTQIFRISQTYDCIKLEFDGDIASVQAGDFVSVYHTMTTAEEYVMYIYDSATTVKVAGAITTATLPAQNGWHDIEFTQAFVDALVNLGSGNWAIRLVPFDFADRFRGSEVRAGIGGGFSFDAEHRGSTAAVAASAVSSHTFSHNARPTAMEQFLVVSVAYSDAAGVVSTVTYNGVSMTSVAARASNGNEHVHNFYLKDPATGAHDVVITYDSVVDSSMPGASDYAFVNQTTQIDATSAGTTGTSVDPTDSVTTVKDKALGVAAVNTNQGTSLLADAPATLIHGTTINTKYGGSGVDTTNKTPAGGQAINFTSGVSSAWVCQALALRSKPAATIGIGAATLTLTGFVPTVVNSGSVIIPIGSAALVLTGFAPSLLFNKRIAIANGALVLTGQVPIVAVHRPNLVEAVTLASWIADDGNLVDHTAKLTDGDKGAGAVDVGKAPEDGCKITFNSGLSGVVAGDTITVEQV